jgi:hypothetical protein
MEEIALVRPRMPEPPPKISLLAENPSHPLYEPWTPYFAGQIEFIRDYNVAWIPDCETKVIVTADTYRQPAVTIIRQAVERGILVLILADGILEYRNTWEHPGIIDGSIFQPVLGHKIACIGRSQARVLESWGNAGKCEVVGLPRLDKFSSLSRRNRSPGEAFRVLIITARTPFFNDEQSRRITQSLRDIKAFFGGRSVLGGIPIEVIWRLTGGLDREIGVASNFTTTNGSELADQLQEVDAVVSTPSTAMLEAMLLGLPTAVLDYCNAPQYVPCAWSITAASHIESVVRELTSPPEPKMLFQETILHDALECRTPATHRMVQLIRGMLDSAAIQASGQLHIPFQILVQPQHIERESRYLPRKLHPRQSAFCVESLEAAQVELAHLRAATQRHFRENRRLVSEYKRNREALSRQVLQHRQMTGLLRFFLSLQNNRRDRSLIVWGAGSFGKAVLSVMRDVDIQVAAVVDSDPSNRDGQAGGHKIIGPDDLIGPNRELPFVLVASSFHEEISATLSKMGFLEARDFMICPEIQRDFP